MRYDAHVKFNHDDSGNTYCASGNTLSQLAKSIALGRSHLQGSPFEIVQFREGREPIIFKQGQARELNGIAIVLAGLVRDAEKTLAKK